MGSHVSKIAATGALASRALAWLVQLPLLGDEELAQLLGVHEIDAARTRRELEGLGWVERVATGSHELRPGWLSFVREEATPALADLLGISREELGRCLALRTRDVLRRIAAMEIAAGINQLFAGLAADPGLRGLELTVARVLPAVGRAANRWWPAGVDAYGCLRAGGLHAPFFVAWDRARAPVVHRRARLATWQAFAKSTGAWGSAGAPPVVVVCADERATGWWESSVRQHVERHGGQPLDLILGTAGALAADGAGTEIWRLPEPRRRALLAERLGWGPAPPAEVAAPSLGELPESLPEVPRRTPPLRRAAAATAAPDSRSGARERLAALTLATDADEKLLLEWVGLHPLLDMAQLAVLLDRPVAAVARRIARLLRFGAVEEMTRLPDGAARSATGFVLGGPGLRWLAARDGVPPRLYARHGAVAAATDGGSTAGTRLDGFVRHVEHSLGVNRTMVRLAADARRAGHRLEEWRSEAESHRRFRDDSSSYWIRPDASGSLSCAGGRHAFLLEYDRGTLDAADHRAKLTGYHRYYRNREFAGDFGGPPGLLAVATDDRAEERFARAARRASREWASQLPLLLTTEWRFARDPSNTRGLLGPIWRAADEPATRWPWLGEGRRPIPCAGGALPDTDPAGRRQGTVPAESRYAQADRQGVR